jgi:hypothetical protein
MNRLLAVLAATCLTASVAYGAVGDLTLKGCDPNTAGGWTVYMSGPQDVAPAPADCGTVNPKAKVVTLKGPGGYTLKVALDSAKADATILDVLRIDATGAGKFTAAASVDLKWPAADGTGAAGINPITLKLTRDGHEVPVGIAGYVTASSDGLASLYLRCGSCLEGQCAFGDKVLTVRIVDSTGNMKMNDPVKVNVTNGAPSGMSPGDMIMIDAGKGGLDDIYAFPSEKAATAEVDGSLDLAARVVAEATRFHLAGFWGQPVMVGGVWYDLAVSDDAAKVSAAPAKGPMGKIKLDADRVNIELVSADRVLMIDAAAGPIDVPAGKYVVARATLRKDKAAVTLSDNAFYQGQGKSIEIVADKVTENPFGPPFMAKAAPMPGAVLKAGQQITLMPTIADEAGRSISNIILAGNPAAKEGEIQVFGADNKQVLAADLVFS